VGVTMTERGTSIEKDVAIVGGGIAGLTSAWKLRDLDVVVLEKEDRAGGRIFSEPRGEYWMNLGAHMFPGPESIIAELLRDVGLETVKLRGDLLKVAHRDKLILRGRPETYPFRMRLSNAGRAALIKTGLRLRRDARTYSGLARRAPGESLSDVRRRLLAYRDDETFAEYLGSLPDDVRELFQAVSNRMTAEPEEVAAGCAVALFAHVWSNDDAVTQAHYLPGGAGVFPARLSERLAHRVVTGAEVQRVSRHADGRVVIEYQRDGTPHEVIAGSAILTTPAYVTAELIDDAPTALATALGQIRYGPFVVMSILTSQSRPMPWDDLYSVLVVDRAFNMFFNHANIVPGAGSPDKPGGSLTIYGGANRARRLLEKSDYEIERSMLDDLYGMFPEARGVVKEVIIKRWERVIPFNTPGRHTAQAALEDGAGNIFLAGDYIGEFVAMESAAQSAVEAVERVRAAIAAQPAERSRT
jgi:protoporphyrinogen/coproporphyrinogen III oxidase